MARIVFAWELGAGLGHFLAIAALGAALRGRGHKVSAITPTQGAVRGVLGPLGIEVLEVPASQPPWRSFPLSVNYSANLLRNGYGHAPSLGRHLAGWEQALRSARPNLLIADHAPAALLASRGAAYPRVAIGQGFTLPPLADPMPSLQPWLTLPEARLAVADRAFVTAVNEALQPMGVPPLVQVSDLFEGVERLLCIEPELDHYEVRADGDYLGAITPEQALPPHAADGAEPRVFVYLGAGNPFLEPVLAALGATGQPSLAYIPGRDAATPEPAATGIRYLTGPMDLRTLTARCRLAILHGGALTVSFFLKRGIQVWVCPQDLEKALLGWRLKDRGLGDALNWFAARPDSLEDPLKAILAADPPPTLGAFCARYRSQTSPVEKITDRLEERLAYRGQA